MALAVTSTASDLGFPVINNQLMRGFLSAANKVLPYFNGTLPGQLERNQGTTTVKWERLNRLTPQTTALGEVSGNYAFGMGRTPEVPVVSALTVTMATYGNYIALTDHVDLFNVNGRAARFLNELGVNAGESYNYIMRNVYEGAGVTNERWAGGVASDAVVVTAIDGNDVKYVVNQLNRVSAMKFEPMTTGSTNIGTTPIRSSYYGICHPDVEEDIRDITGFIPVEQYAGQTATLVGEFGAVNGVRWVSTEIASINSGGGTSSANGLRGPGTSSNDLYTSIIYGMEAVGSVGLGMDHVQEIYESRTRLATFDLVQGEAKAGPADPYGEVQTIAWKGWLAGKILNTDWIWKVTTAASDLA